MKNENHIKREGNGEWESGNMINTMLYREKGLYNSCLEFGNSMGRERMESEKKKTW